MNKTTYSLILGLFASLTLMSAHAQTGTGQNRDKLIHWEAAKDDFPLLTKGMATPVCVDTQDFTVVHIASRLFAEDVERVGGVKPALCSDTRAAGDYLVVAGTIGKSRLIDSLIRAKKLDVAAVQGKWESHIIATLEQPWPNVRRALVIAGSDRRGTAYGLFTLSEAMGVSPWYWWADVTPAKHACIYVSSGAHIQGPPSIKYRGIFINDEFAGLHPWASKNFDRTQKHIGPKTYAKIFELLLRLKANYVWPAMWGGARYFNVYPENKIVADDYAIVMGSSHCEQLLFNNSESAEWDEKKDGPWNFMTNRERILEAWTRRLKENGRYENIYTLGLRGVHDRPIQGGTNAAEKAVILQAAIDEQRKLLAQHISPQVERVPQLFCPYREVLELYEKGVKVPDDVTLMWADDNYGWMRRLSSPEEQKRPGRAGIYYHISFFLNIWICTYSPSQISYELSKAYAYGADRVWVINVGDIKPAEKEITFIMQLAWDVNRWSPERAHLFLKEWSAETFGEQYADKIYTLLMRFYQLAAVGTPDFLDRHWGGVFSPSENAERLTAYRQLGEEAEALYGRMPERLKDAFYQLVLYPVQGSRWVNEKSLLARQSFDLAAKGNPDALSCSKASLDALQKGIEMTIYYNKTLAHGKWNHIMEGFPKAKLETASNEMVQTRHVLWPKGMKPTPADPLMKVHAPDYTRKQETPDYRITTIPGIGFTDGLSTFPLLAPSLSTNNLSQAAWVEYDLSLPDGNLLLSIRALPTQRTQKSNGVRYAVSLNGAPAVIFDSHSDEGQALWWENIKRGYTVCKIPYSAKQPRKVCLRISFLDPGLVLQDIVVENK